MAYSRSSPFKSFYSEIDEIILVLKKVNLKSNTNLDIKFKDYILSSSVFLAHAELENYIEDIFNLYLRNLSQKKFFDLNEDLRSFLVYKFFKDNNIHQSILMNDEKEVIHNWEGQQIVVKQKEQSIAQFVTETILTLRWYLVNKIIDELKSDLVDKTENDNSEVLSMVVDYLGLTNIFSKKLGRVMSRHH